MEATQTMNAIRGHHRSGSESSRTLKSLLAPCLIVARCWSKCTQLESPRPSSTWDPTWTDEQSKSRSPIIPSDEISGVVAKVGTDALNIAAGDEVYGLIDFFPQWRGGGVRDCQGRRTVAQAAERGPSSRGCNSIVRAYGVAGISYSRLSTRRPACPD